MSDQSNSSNNSSSTLPVPKKIDELTSNRTHTLNDGSGQLSDDTKTTIRNYGYMEETADDAGDWFSNLFTTDYFWNTNREPSPSFNFFLRIEGAFDAPCRAVRAFSKENEFEEIQEGGRNDYVILKRKPNTRRFTLQVERYVGIDKIDPLQLGTEMVLPMLLAVSRVTASSAGFVDTMTETEFIRFYAFTGCIVTGKEYGELNAEQSGLLKETTTIAYREMIALTNPNADMVKNPWDITAPTKNRRSHEINRTWDESKATVRKWSVNAPKGVPDTSTETPLGPDGTPDINAKPPLIDTRSAARPVNEADRSSAVLWGGLNSDNPDVAKNRRATIGANDSERGVVSGWKVPKGEEKSTAKGSRHAAVKDNFDNAKATVKSWKFKKGGDKKNRAAEIPKQDEKRAKVKAWNMDPTLSRQSKAAKPTGDKRHAKNRMFNVKKPDKFKFAKAPEGDELRALLAGYKIEDNSGQRATTPPSSAKAEQSLFNIKEPTLNKKASVSGKDEARAEIKKFVGQAAKRTPFKTVEFKVRLNNENKKANSPQSDKARANKSSFNIKNSKINKKATTPKGDSQRAKKSSFDLRKKATKKANAPGEDVKRNKVSGFNIKHVKVPSSTKAKASTWKTTAPVSNRSAVIPPQDSKKAQAKMWDFRNPTENRSAVTIKGAAAVAAFLSGGKK